MDDELKNNDVEINTEASNNTLLKKLKPQANLASLGWLARLDLEFNENNGRSFLAKKQHVGPLVIQKTLHPEGDAICHGIIIHPPGGVAGGDELIVNVDLAYNANALLTTPGAGKWYKANGAVASQHLNFNVATNAQLEWFPQENILFDGAQVALTSDVLLATDARFASWEILCFGRQARGELWQIGKIKQRLNIIRDGQLIWNERAFIRPQSRVMQSLVGLHGNVVSGGFVVAAGLLPKTILEACQQVKINSAAKVGVTALPEIFSARYIGQSGQEARQYFEQLWQILRPWYSQREAVRPRIWNT